MSQNMSAQLQRRIFGRCLFLQSCWSFERMQSLGFYFILEPWLKSCYGGQREQLREARLRQLEFFNTQPHIASLVVGMVCALEEEAAAAAAEERPAKLARLRALKTAAAAALAGLGDVLFWQTLRPFCAALALAAALILARRNLWAAAAWAAAGAYLVAYNAPALTLRWRFLRRGYEWKEQIAVHLKAWPGQRLIKILRLLGLVLALAATVLMLRAVPQRQWLLGAMALAASLGLKVAGFSAYRIYAAAAMAGLCASLAGWL